MNVVFKNQQIAANYEAKAIIIYQDDNAALIPTSLNDEIKRLTERKLFKHESSDVKKFYVDGKAFYICTLGKEKAVATFEDLRFLAHKLFAAVNAERFNSLTIEMQTGGLDKAKSYAILAEFAELARYKFDWFKSDKFENNFETLTFIDDDDYSAAVKEGLILAKAQKAARYLVDEPANIMTPAKMAEMAQQYGTESGFEVDVFDEPYVREQGMHAYLAVAQGSTKKPLKLIVMRYRGADQDAPIYGLVGKGLSYDAGGYSLKPTSGMVDMKMDMGGAATVIGAMKAIADAKLKINVTAVVAACQNLIGPEAYLPGDIIDTMNGKTVFIGNTDAEGRLTLIDAITYIIRKENVVSVFDFATLTGAALYCFGNACAAAVTNNDDIYAEYAAAAEEIGEKVWRLPIFREYKELIKHKDADLTNSAGNPGTITAGMFLGEFVEDKPWIHVDIAPVAHVDKAYGCYDRGATGYGVKTCYQFMKAKQTNN